MRTPLWCRTIEAAVSEGEREGVADLEESFRRPKQPGPDLIAFEKE